MSIKITTLTIEDSLPPGVARSSLVLRLYIALGCIGIRHEFGVINL